MDVDPFVGKISVLLRVVGVILIGVLMVTIGMYDLSLSQEQIENGDGYIISESHIDNVDEREGLVFDERMGLNESYGEGVTVIYLSDIDGSDGEKVFNAVNRESGVLDEGVVDSGSIGDNGVVFVSEDTGVKYYFEVSQISGGEDIVDDDVDGESIPLTVFGGIVLIGTLIIILVGCWVFFMGLENLFNYVFE